MNQIVEAFSEVKHTLGIFIYLFIAFDTVNHNTLLEKLKAYRIQSENLKWFISYSSNRKQKWTFLHVVFSKFYIRAFAFSCFCNTTKILDPVLLVDDANLFCSENNIRALFEIVKQELSQINDWFFANKHSLNVEKTKYLLFHKLTDQQNIPLKTPSLQLNRNIIEREIFLKFYVVILDDRLTSKKHIQFIIETKVSKNADVLYKISKLINCKCLRSICFFFIHS